MKIAICDDCRQDALRLKALLNGNHDAVLYSGAKQLLEDVKGRGSSGYVVNKTAAVLEEWFGGEE